MQGSNDLNHDLNHDLNQPKKIIYFFDLNQYFSKYII